MKKSPYKFLILFIFSFFINIILLLPYCDDIYKSATKKEYFSKKDNDDKVICAVLSKSYTLIDKDLTSYKEKKGLFQDLVNYYYSIRVPNSGIPDFFYPRGYLLAGLSFYAEKNHDSQLFDFLEAKSTDLIDENGNFMYELKTVDQVPIGLFFIRMFEYSKQTKYLNAVKKLFAFVSDNTEDGVITYRRNSEINCVDGLGMTIPFLYEYFLLTNNPTAYELAANSMQNYQLYGVDLQTGIPAHGYNKELKVKVGSANWGRGIGWYLLAAAFLPSFSDSILDNTIDHYSNYTQYPFVSGHFDSSTALMFEIYKKKKGLSYSLNLDFLKEYITTDGIVDSMSGDTYGLNDYSHNFGGSGLTNGLLLLWLSL